MPLRPADVHPHQHLGPVGRVHPAGLGADGHQRLALVVLARQQRADLHRLEVLAELLELGVRLGQRVGVVLLRGQLEEHRQVVEALSQRLDPAQLALSVRELTGDLLGSGLVVPEVGIGGLVFQLFDAAPQAVDIEHALHRGQGGVECGDICLTVGIHGSSGYRPGSSP